MTKVYTREERVAWLKTLHANPAGAAVLLETADRRILIVKANYRQYWTLPGGVIDKGESPLEAAIREVKEEVGLMLEPSQVEFVGVGYCRSEEIDLYRFDFRCTITDEQVVSIATQDSEIEEYVLETADQIKSAVRFYAPTITSWANGESLNGYFEEEMLF